MSEDDGAHMARAIRLGERALGTTGDNPPVGCVLVKDKRIVGLGWTQPGGRPHAEIMALKMAGDAARGATAYVTLEPCSHHGRSGPCAMALAQAGVSRVVAAWQDPDARVSGQGLAALRDAGLAVEVGLGAMDALFALAGFFSRILRNRPQVIVKIAVSSDWKIAESPGCRTAITGPESSARVQMLRAQCGGILVGANTVRVDNPELTVRLPGLEDRSPRPVVLSRTGLWPPDAWINARTPIIMRDLDLAPLAEAGMNRLLVEGGAETVRAFLEAGLVDVLHVFQAPHSLGTQGVAAFAGLDPGLVLANFSLVATEMLGVDRHSVYQMSRAQG